MSTASAHIVEGGAVSTLLHIAKGGCVAAAVLQQGGLGAPVFRHATYQGKAREPQQYLQLSEPHSSCPADPSHTALQTSMCT